MKWNGHHLAGKTKAAAAVGLFQAAEHVLAKSREVVPLEEGTLSRSGVSSVDPASLTAAVSYATPYAARQHEELTYRHDPGRTAKYLERPVNEERSKINDIIGAQIRQALQ